MTAYSDVVLNFLLTSLGWTWSLSAERQTCRRDPPAASSPHFCTHRNRKDYTHTAFATHAFVTMEARHCRLEWRTFSYQSGVSWSLAVEAREFWDAGFSYRDHDVSIRDLVITLAIWRKKKSSGIKTDPQNSNVSNEGRTHLVLSAFGSFLLYCFSCFKIHIHIFSILKNTVMNETIWRVLLFKKNKTSLSIDCSFWIFCVWIWAPTFAAQAYQHDDHHSRSEDCQSC